jgi:hypothetical protein
MTHQDPHQAAEAAAFILTHSPGREAKDTTGDLFGFDYDDLEHWHQDQQTKRQRRATGPDLFGGA